MITDQKPDDGGNDLRGKAERTAVEMLQTLNCQDAYFTIQLNIATTDQQSNLATSEDGTSFYLLFPFSTIVNVIVRNERRRTRQIIFAKMKFLILLDPL